MYLIFSTFAIFIQGIHFLYRLTSITYFALGVIRSLFFITLHPFAMFKQIIPAFHQAQFLCKDTIFNLILFEIKLWGGIICFWHQCPCQCPRYPGLISGPLPFYRVDLFHAVEGICKDSGVSITAKSLFASLPHQIPKKAVFIQPQKDGFVTEEGNNFCKLGNIQGFIHEFYKAFNTHNRHQMNIGLQPFQGGCGSVELDN